MLDAPDAHDITAYSSKGIDESVLTDEKKLAF